MVLFCRNQNRIAATLNFVDKKVSLLKIGERINVVSKTKRSLNDGWSLTCLIANFVNREADRKEQWTLNAVCPVITGYSALIAPPVISKPAFGKDVFEYTEKLTYEKSLKILRYTHVYRLARCDFHVNYQTLLYIIR